MALMDRIRACTQTGPERRLPLRVDGQLHGHVAPALARALTAHPDVFVVRPDEVSFHARLAAADARSEAVAGVVRHLVAAGHLTAWRGEAYPVRREWDDAPVFTLDRGAVGAFGTSAYGVHLNGWTETDAGPHLWIARRSSAQAYPERLDHLVAGGQPVGLGLRQNLEKECAEEAGLGGALTHGLQSVHALRYQMEDEYGFHDDTLYCFDLVLPSDFVPRPTDGEVLAFACWPLDRVKTTLRDTTQFKTNVALVIIDWLLRHGHLDGDPEQAQLLTALEPLRRAYPAGEAQGPSPRA